MNPEAALIVELLGLGLVAGFLAGLLGVGGGMMMVPILSWVLRLRGVEPGVAVKMAIATSMATIVFTSLSSVRAHQRHAAVRWRIVAAMAPGLVFGGMASGAAAFAIIKGQGLALLFTAFIGWSGLRMWRDPEPLPSRSLPGPAGQALVGAGIGFAAGLLGAGGAFLSVPFMTWCNVPPRQAVGTSAALGFPIAVASTLGYLVSGRHLAPALPGALGYLYLPGLVLMATGSVSLAPWGARIAHRVDPGLLRRLFAGLLGLLAAGMLFQALAP